MCRVIHKQTIEDVQEGIWGFTALKGAKPISVGLQDGEVRMWYEVDPKETRHEDVKFLVAWTGRACEIQDNAVFLGTVVQGSLVHHIYHLRGT